MVYSKIVKLCGIDVNSVRQEIEALQELSDLTYEITDNYGDISIVLSADMDETMVKGAVKDGVKAIKNCLSSFIYTTHKDVTLEQTFIELLTANGLTVSTAESCTGGLLSGRIVNVAGASEAFKAGIVAYSNKAKRKLLGVKRGTLEKYGAVSEKTANEMAREVAELVKADVGISTTGIAGPEGGTKDTPVGTVFIACYIGNKTYCREYHFEGDRNSVRTQSVIMAINFARESVLKHISKEIFQ